MAKDHSIIKSFDIVDIRKYIHPFTMVAGKGPGPERICLGPVGSVWVLHFMQERFHSMSPGD